MAKQISNKPQRGNVKGGRGGKPRPSNEGQARNIDNRPNKQSSDSVNKSKERR